MKDHIEVMEFSHSVKLLGREVKTLEIQSQKFSAQHEQRAILRCLCFRVKSWALHLGTSLPFTCVRYWIFTYTLTSRINPIFK